MTSTSDKCKYKHTHKYKYDACDACDTCDEQDLICASTPIHTLSCSKLTASDLGTQRSTPLFKQPGGVSPTFSATAV